MLAKALEIRDQATFIPVLAVDMNPRQVVAFADGVLQLDKPAEPCEAQRYLLRRCGYPCDGTPNIVITRLSADGDPACNDPYYWRQRTFAVAHNYILEHWNELRDGDVVDVEYILGETTDPKQSERVTSPLD